MINITPSFSSVTNISSWRAKSALSNLVSLSYIRGGYKARPALSQFLSIKIKRSVNSMEIGKSREWDFEAQKLWKCRSGRSGCLAERMITNTAVSCLEICKLLEEKEEGGNKEERRPFFQVPNISTLSMLAMDKEKIWVWVETEIGNWAFQW